MKNKLDFKSALIGLAVGASVTLSIGAAVKHHTTHGRYQINGTASHALIIDTSTGQAWSAYLPQSGGKTDSQFWDEK